jgi:hypothetical protein
MTILLESLKKFCALFPPEGSARLEYPQPTAATTKSSQKSMGVNRAYGDERHKSLELSIAYLKARGHVKAPVRVTYPFTKGVENDPPSGDNHPTSFREKELPSPEDYFL